MRSGRIARACALIGALYPAWLPAAPGLRGDGTAARAPLAADHALEYVLGIVVVMLALGVFAFAMRRLQSRLGAGSASLRVAASLALGGKERVVVIEAEGERLLLGVGSGGVQLLRKLRPAGSAAAGVDPAHAPDSWLARTLRSTAAR